MGPDDDDTVARRPALIEPAPADLDDTLGMGTLTRRIALRAEPPASGPPPSRPALSSGPVGLRHRLSIGGADPIPLDRPVLIGRRPRPPRIPDGIAPLLVTVHSPEREISATHLEVRQVGSTVVARDLRTTNGSRIALPGSGTRVLAGGESLAVPAGTRIDLGDSVEVVVLAPGFAPDAGER